MLFILDGMDQVMVQTGETVESPQLQSIQVVDISFIAKRQFSMVQTSQLTTEVPQLPFVFRWSMSLFASRAGSLSRRGAETDHDRGKTAGVQV